MNYLVDSIVESVNLLSHTTSLIKYSPPFCLHFVILQRKAEIDQLMEGLNDLGFLQFLKMHPGPARSLLFSARQKLAAASLEQLFLVHFSEPGSNRRCEEESYDGVAGVPPRYFNIAMHVF